MTTIRPKTVTFTSPKAFVKSLHCSFKLCRQMEKTGASKSAIGWAFYRAMSELFGDDPGETPADIPLAVPPKKPC